LFAIAIYMKST